MSAEELFQICSDVVEDKLPIKDGLESLKNLYKSDKTIASRLFDILVVIESDADTPEKTTKLKELVNGIKDTVIPADIITVEIESNQDIHKKALIRHKTRLYFKQSKFNLLREESEGYGKLITELLEVGLNETTPDMLKTRILSLIGQFNLDPNRVLSIILQCFECVSRERDFFIELLKAISPDLDHLRGLIVFHYSFYQVEGKKTPMSLYEMTAALIKAGLIDLLKITGFLQPNAEGIKNTHRLRSSTASQRAKKAETIITTQIAAENSRGRDMDRDNGDGENVVGVSFAAVAATQDAEDDRILADLSEEDTLTVNQKLGLICALLEDGQWNNAQYLIDRLPEFYAVQSGPRICRAIAALIDDSIDKFYRQKCCSLLLLDVETDRQQKTPVLAEITSWNDLVENTAPILWYLGPRIGYSPNSATKLIRLVTKFFEERTKDPSTSSEKVANTMMDIVDECLLCSVSIQVNSPNVALSEELWALLQLFPYQQRYRLYGRWKFTHTSRHPELSVNKSKVLGRTKYILKRLSKETVKVMGRQLGKLCHVHPMTVMDYMLSMVQTFDNFIGPVVDSLKFLTSLEFDILSFCLMEQLANPDRLQLKSSDGNLSMWLQALGTMVGSICKKYNVELTGILNYVANQLKNNKGFDLLILREIIQNMSSVESSLHATEEQLEAMSGGEVLKLEAGGFSNARNKRASVRLRDAVLDGELAFGLCVLIAQQREFIVYRDSVNLPLKLVGEMVDQCRDTFVQFGSFLMLNLKYDEYCKRIPNAATLMEECGLPVDVSMFLTRPFFSHLVIDAYNDSKKLRKTLDTDATKKLDAMQKSAFFKSAIDSVVEKIMTELEAVHVLQNSKNVKVIGIKMLVIYWMLSTYDIHVPVNTYEKAQENIRRQMKDAENNDELSKTKRAKEVERLVSLESRLKEEQRKQMEHVERVRMWLAASQEDLFAEKGQASIPFLATCVLKRAIFSESDAIFSAKFVLLLHQIKTTYFQTMIFYDKIFNDLLPFITGLTETEACAFGRFLDILLCQANKWNLSKELYDKECNNYPGFYIKVGGSTQQTALSLTTFKALTFKWQSRLYQCFSGVLKNTSSDYVVIRNCFVMMAKMINSFPVTSDHSKPMEEVVIAVQKREKGKRDDLALLASSYIARLKANQKNLVERQVYAPTKKPAKPATKVTLTTEKKRVAETNSATEPAKRTKTEKKNDENSEKKVNGATKENKEPTPKEEKEKVTEDGEVTPEQTPKKTISNLNGREHEKDIRSEKTPRTKRKDENGEKKEHRDDLPIREKKEDNHREKKDHRDDSGREKKEIKEERHRDERKAEKKEEKNVRENDRKKDDTKSEKKEPKSESRRTRTAESKEEKRKEEDPKRRRETIKEAETAGPIPPPKEERREKRDAEKKDETKSRRVEVKREEKKEDRHVRQEKVEDKKDEGDKKEESRSDRKRITINRPDRDEPGVKISRTMSGGKMAKTEPKIPDRIEPAQPRKHREISPPREDSLRRSSGKETFVRSYRR